MSSNYFFSVKAAERMTQRPVKSVTLWRNGVILVRFQDGSMQSMEQTAFKQEFVTFRQQQSKAIVPTKITPTRYQCQSSTKNKCYEITIEAERLKCDCKDWRVQAEAGLKRPCCKHCYAVLREIGCRSLQDFLAMPF